jgi:protoporphyrinogen oxidase
VLVTEARERVGGNITSRSDPAAGYLWEEGPNSFQPNDSMLKAAVDAGVADQLVFGDPKAPRFVWWEGKLRPTPSGPPRPSSRPPRPCRPARPAALAPALALGAWGRRPPLPAAA